MLPTIGVYDGCDNSVTGWWGGKFTVFHPHFAKEERLSATTFTTFSLLSFRVLLSALLSIPLPLSSSLLLLSHVIFSVLPLTLLFK